MKHYFFIITIALMLASCTQSDRDIQTAVAQTQAAWTPTPTAPQETSQAFRFGDPVESESNALIAAQSGLRASFDYTEPLTVVKVEQMSYEEYSKFVGEPNDRPTGIQVWLIIYFDDQWQVGPRPMGTPPPPFHGCVSVAINAADGMPLEVGGPLQSGKITECDK
jgi:hypothetical protein